ncbi:MAG: hypothetical protein IJI23_11530 [Lachnospiraceae bacterium]|nr:hypothetical protein [Lachnospiraceae bacterium]
MNRLRIILRENHTLHEMMLGIIAANAVLAVAALFVNDRNRALTAVLIGAVTALVFVIHMAVTVDDALCLDEKGAVSQMRTQMLIRYLFVAIVVGLSLYFKIANPVFLTISVLTIKAGAYLQPSIHKLINRRWDK